MTFEDCNLKEGEGPCIDHLGQGCYSLFIEPVDITTEVLLTKKELERMLEEVGNL